MGDISLENVNLSTVHTDISHSSDNEVPSLSINDGDEDFNDNQFYIKEHNDKMEKLRKENFDLKLKLYLLENNENFSTNKDLKLKVIKEFDRKDGEIHKLQKLLEKQGRDNRELKVRLKNIKLLRKEHYEEFIKVNNELKTRVSTSVGIFLNLIDSVESLIQNYRNNEAFGNDDMNVESLTKTIEHLENASKFIINNSEHLSAHLDPKQSSEKLKQLQEYGKQNILNISQIDSQEICAKEFLKIVDQFQSLLIEFRANRINYRQFSNEMDSLMVNISSQHRVFENLYLNQLDSNRRLRQLQAILAKKDKDQQRFDSDLGKCLQNLDEMILTAKNVTQTVTE